MKKIGNIPLRLIPEKTHRKKTSIKTSLFLVLVKKMQLIQTAIPTKFMYVSFLYFAYAFHPIHVFG
jgi:hypothetical protein